MSVRSAARGNPAAKSIRFALRTSSIVATSSANFSRCVLRWLGSRRLRSALMLSAIRVMPSTTQAGQSGEARIFLIQDDNLTAEVPLRRSILQSTLRRKYRSTGRHNPQRDGGPEKGLYRLHPIALGFSLLDSRSTLSGME